MTLVRAEDVSKTYMSGEVEVQALKGLSFEIEPVSFVSFVGPSGSGKTTLLNLVGCLDKPTEGDLVAAGEHVNTLGRKERAAFRGAVLGFIFQAFNLIPVLTAFENVEYPLVMIRDESKPRRRDMVLNTLEAVGIVEQKDKRPDQLSGGQKQRVAVARAMVTRPKLVLADEPTANLDQNTALNVVRLMRSMRDEFGTTFVLSTHDPRITHEAEVIHTLQDGRLFLRTNAELKESSVESSGEITIFEGYVSLKPTPLLTVDLGKKTLKWGKGYAWNPVAFVDRPKDPDDPGLPLEGFIVASADYIKSFSGPLQTVSFTPVIIPVYENINDDFGKINSVDFAGKLYFLFHDTDIDFMFLRGNSRASRFGIDFSRNISSNCAIHGEFAFVDDFEKKFIDGNGMTFQRRYDAKSYILGMRYLTRYDTTFMFEYYRNGTGYGTGEMNDFFEFVNN